MAEIVGRDATYWWRLQNQLGYLDGLQIELMELATRSAVRLQWVVAAGCLRPAVVEEI